MQNLFEIRPKLLRDCVVYRLTIRGKSYIGSTVDLYDRMGDHCALLKKGKHYSKHLQRCFDKYGESELYIETIYRFKLRPSKQELLQKEKEYIELEKPIFNSKLDPTTDYNCATTSRKVYQYDLDGNFIKEFPSCREAQRQLGITGVSHAANPKMIAMSAGGWRWSYRKVKKLSKYVNNSKLAKAKSVTVYRRGELVGKYTSIADAARDMFPYSSNFASVCASISSVILGKTKQYKEYNFK
jgi:hypothetical protein